ncbi:hypothetical protein BH23BAC3_BH23BAC3_28830 [soil metagenome]
MPSPKQNATGLLNIKLRATFELLRPANIVTAFADILAGAAAAVGFLLLSESDFLFQPHIYWLLLATFGLYGGGIVFNDVFDADLDASERPERAIPSGRVSKLYAAILGTILLLLGITSAFVVNQAAGTLAIFITICAIYYDAKAKHSNISGPLFMGSCRGGNLMLGAALFPEALVHLWPLALIPIAYIGSITLISQGEVKGGSKITGIIATSIAILITALLILLAYLPVYDWTSALPFTLLFGVMVIPPFIKAAKEPVPGLIKKAVKRGVLSLIILNSALAAGFAGFTIGIIILLLLPVSVLFAKLFAVT